MRNKGITMVEVIIATAIFSLVIIAAGKFAKDVLQLNTQNQNRYRSEVDSRKVLRPIIAEIRSASPSSIGSYPIEQAATSSFIFYSDVNDDGIKERIRYFIDGKNLRRGQVTPTGSPLVYNLGSEQLYTMIENVYATATPIFYYYDTNYTGTTSPLSTPVQVSAVRLIKLRITIDKNPNDLPGPVVVEGQVSIRNLKDNL